ncbi:developmental regulator VosA [Rhizophagus clarus]|uniref:Developmental regulator VosA n=1 Tax=Rhizophagus clarus TaxID=94130 RepID=A0A8H3LNQ9_9GLOM|nr:developmental regulator VosA [Rhizophagus clarus]
MDDIVSYQFAQVRQRRDERQEIQYELILRQQPKQSRMCGIGEKADRRPIDPPPIIQLKVYDASLPQSEKRYIAFSSFLQNPYFFMYASLVAPDTDEELHLLRDGKTRSTTGSVVSSLYHLKDIDNSDAGFFVFPDLSVRMEGTYRLKLSLFEIIGREVYHCKSIFSDIFIVYSAKRFPGMEESTFLSRSFADQGLKIRIRKEIRIRRRLAKRDRKELELIDQSVGNRSKRPRSDGKRDDNESGDSSDVDMHERAPPVDDSRSKLSTEPAPSGSYDKRKEHESRSSSSPRRVPYDHIPPHMAHYDPNAPIYGPAGYPPHRPHPWHDRPDYLADPHYPPYYDPYDRRYGYHPYYYPPPPHPLPDSADHHRYPYPPPPAYGRPPIYPGQPTPGYYDTPPRVPHPANESPGAVRPPPYGYDPSSPYPPQRGGPWPHYGERSQSRDPGLESSPSPYRGSGHVTPPPPPRGHPMYYPPPHDYYAPYGHPIGHPPPKQDYSTPVDPSLTGDPQNKIPIQDLLSTEQQQSSQSSQSNQSNTEQSSVTPSRMYGGPPSAFAHIYHHPARPHDYMRHDIYGRPPYDMGYPPPHEISPYQNSGSSSSPINKSQSSSQPPPPDTGRPATSASSTSESVRQENRNVEYNAYDPARRSAYSESTGNSNASSAPASQASSYSATSTSSSQQLKSPPRTQTSQSSFDHSQSYSQNRGSYGSDHGNGGNSSKNNGVSSNVGSSNNEKITSPRYPPRRQGDVEDFGYHKKHNELHPQSNFYATISSQ